MSLSADQRGRPRKRAQTSHVRYPRSGSPSPRDAGGEVERELRRYGIQAERSWIAAEDLASHTDEERDEGLERVIQAYIDVDLPDWAVGPYRGGTAPYDPDLDDGVKVNILPLQAARLLP